jgi:hypothetical protein
MTFDWRVTGEVRAVYYGGGGEEDGPASDFVFVTVAGLLVK